MDKRKSLKELKEIITADIKYHTESIETFRGNMNPQVISMYNHAVSRVEALTDVLDYIEVGQTFQFIKD